MRGDGATLGGGARVRTEVVGYTIERELIRSPIGGVWTASASGGGAGASARPGGGKKAPGPGRFVVRTHVIDPLFGPGANGAVGAYARAAQFFASMSRQRRLAKAGAAQEGPVGAGGGHLAVVHTLEATSEGGAAVFDAYGMTAADLIGARVQPPAHVLYELVSGVVHGLTVIGAVDRGRAHGDLRPAHVLIDDRGGAGRWRVGLMGVAPGSVVDADGDAARLEDLRGLGRLIYEVVEHKPFRALGGYPVQSNSGWAALEPRARGWLALVNRLLDPDAKPGRIRLADVATEVAALEASAPKTGRNVYAATAAGLALVLIGGGAAAYLATREPPQVKAAFDEQKLALWCDAYRTWYGDFDPEAKADTVQALDAVVGLDPYLATSVRALVAAETDSKRIERLNPLKAGERASKAMQGKLVGEVDCEGPAVLAVLRDLAPEVVATDNQSGFGGEIEENVDLMSRLLAALEPANWAKRGEVEARAALWRGRGWEAAAARLELVSADVDPSDNSPAAKPFTGDLRAVIEAAERSAALEAKWSGPGGLEGRIAALAKAGEAAGAVPADPVLGGLASAVGRALSAVSGEGEAALAALDASFGTVDAALKAGEAFVADTASGWAAVDREALMERSAFLAGIAAGETPIEVATLAAWVAEAGRAEYRLPAKADDPRNGGEGSAWAGATTNLKNMRATLDELTTKYADAWAAKVADVGRDFASELSTLVAEADGLAGLRWTQRTRPEIESSVTALAERVSGLLVPLNRAANEVRVKWEELAPQIRAENTPASLDTLNAAWRSQRDVWLEQLEPAAGAAERERVESAQKLQQGTDDLRELLLAIAASLEGARPVIDRAPASLDAAALAAGIEVAARERREVAAGAALEAARSSDGYRASDAATAALGELVKREEAWSSGVAALLADVAEVDAMLARAGLPEEVDGGGVAFAARLERSLTNPLLVDVGGRALQAALGADGGLMAAARRVWALASEADAAALAAAAESSAETAAARRVAYQRLASRGGAGAAWPATAAELERDLAAWTAARQSASSLTDAGRADAVRAWYDAARLERWDRVASGVASGVAGGEGAALIERAMALREGYGITAETALSAAAAYNSALYDLARGIDTAGEDDVVRPALQAAVARLEPLAAAAGRGGEAWLARVRELSLPPRDPRPTIEPGKVGPGSVGWTVDPAPPDFSRLTYRRDGLAVTFVLINRDQARGLGFEWEKDCYLATEEVSIELFNAVIGPRLPEIAASGAWGGLKGRIDEVAARKRGSWNGPRTWDWSAAQQALVPGTRWIPDDPLWEAASPFAEGLRDPAEPTDYIGPQTAQSPVNGVSANAARAMAVAAGCRLPTAQEWQAAARVYESGTGTTWNLRDQSWRRQWDWSQVWLTEAKKVDPKLTSGLSSPSKSGIGYATDPALKNAASPGPLVPAEDDGAAHPFDDGSLWFEPVDRADRGTTLRHLLGNVAEMVQDVADGEPASYGVIGSSAMAHPNRRAEAEFRPAIGPPQGTFKREGNPEVGFRLAFSAVVRERVGSRLAKELGALPYVVAAAP